MSFTSNNDFIEFLEQLKREYADRIAFSKYIDGSWENKSYQEFYDEVYLVARYFRSLGYGYRHKIAILSESRIEWPIFAFGALLAGATLVPIDIKLTASEIINISEHAEVDLFLYSENEKEKLLEVIKSNKINSVGLEVSKKTIDEIVDDKTIVIDEIEQKEMNLLMYTSGTSGKPKGVMVKLSAIMFEMNATYDIVKTDEEECFLSMLPITHLFEFTVGLCTPLACGAEICISESLEKEHLMFCLNERKVSQIVTVPLFVKNIKDGIERNIKAAPKLKQQVFKGLMKAASITSNNKFKKKVFSAIHEKFGGKLKRMLIGSACLSREILDFYDNIGIRLYEGYGLTETGPIISTNTIPDYRKGSVGKPLGTIQVKIDNQDSEILTKGSHLLSGYYKDQSLSKEAFKEGWFCTGDIGHLDKDGFLYITGRKKKMIVLEGGKKVHTEEIETLFQNDEYIKEVSALGVNQRNLMGDDIDSTNVVLAIVPTDEMRDFYKEDEKKLEQLLITRAKLISKNLASYKKPSDFIIFKEDMPKTSTQKVKFNLVKDIVISALANKQAVDSVRPNL